MTKFATILAGAIAISGLATVAATPAQAETMAERGEAAWPICWKAALPVNL